MVHDDAIDVVSDEGEDDDELGEDENDGIPTYDDEDLYQGDSGDEDERSHTGGDSYEDYEADDGCEYDYY
jgi:hypothetical protein